MTKNEWLTKYKNVFYGLAIGDALSWNSIYHRSYLYPAWTRRLRREIDHEAEQSSIIKTSLPFALNQQPYNYHICPTDSTEWLAFNLQIINDQGGRYKYEKHLESWISLSKQKDKVRGSIGVIAALDNISKGKYPPISGKDNPHYFDDSSMYRTIPILLSELNELDNAFGHIEKDASITNSLDGIECALLYNRLLYYSITNNNIKDSIDQLSCSINNNSWTGSIVNEALDLSRRSSSLLDLALKLNDKIVDHSYNYGTCAPINLAIVIALLNHYNNNFNEILFAANTITKVSDSVTPLIGAIMGAMADKNILTDEWQGAIKLLKGVCLPHLSNADFLKLVEIFCLNSLERIGS